MRVEIGLQKVKAIHLIQVVDGQQNEKIEKCLLALRPYAESWEIQKYKKHSIFNVKRGKITTRQSTNYYPTAHNFETDPDWTQKCARLPWPIVAVMFPLEKINEFQEETIGTIRSYNF